MILRARTKDSLLIFDSRGTVLAEVPCGGMTDEGERTKVGDEAVAIARAIAEKLGVTMGAEP